MLISRHEVIKFLDGEKQLPDEQRTYQPGLTLAHFSSLRKDNTPVDDTKVFCETCRFYEPTCKYILEAFAIQTRPHGRKQE